MKKLSLFNSHFSIFNFHANEIFIRIQRPRNGGGVYQGDPQNHYETLDFDGDLRGPDTQPGEEWNSRHASEGDQYGARTGVPGVRHQHQRDRRGNPPCKATGDGPLLFW